MLNSIFCSKRLCSFQVDFCLLLEIYLVTTESDDNTGRCILLQVLDPMSGIDFEATHLGHIIHDQRSYWVSIVYPVYGFESFTSCSVPKLNFHLIIWIRYKNLFLHITGLYSSLWVSLEVTFHISSEYRWFTNTWSSD